MDQRVVRPAEAAKILSLSVSTLRRLELRGEFPPRISLGANSVGWRLGDILAWMASRPTAGRTVASTASTAKATGLGEVRP